VLSWWAYKREMAFWSWPRLAERSYGMGLTDHSGVVVYVSVYSKKSEKAMLAMSRRFVLRGMVGSQGKAEV
jgi:hypothetical protein